MSGTTQLALTTLRYPGLVARDRAESAQYLTFGLAGEQYGIDILKVQEIKGWTPVTRIPSVPAFMRGVMNLRGAIVPIIDLRHRLGLDTIAYSSTTVVILAMVKEVAGDRTIGLVVDGVSDVLGVRADEVQPPPDFGPAGQTEFINGLVTIDAGMVMLLDVDRLLNVAGLAAPPGQMAA